MKEQTEFGAFRKLPFMGVIYVVAEAEKLGFYNGHPDWCNLGQGQPEVGEMEGAPARYSELKIQPEDHAYGPIHGTEELREKIAEHYNRLYRKNSKSKYNAENVAVASGGRLALTRTLFSLGKINLGYQLPDYTAYEDMMAAQMHRITPIPVRSQESDGFKIPADKFNAAVKDLGLNAFMISNPCNPTGNVIKGKELQSWIDSAKENNCTLIMDEFYSHFMFNKDGSPADEGVSSASCVDDVNQDQVLIVDGLTKNFRYPGWRVGWVVGPKDFIDCYITAGSSIDGGPSKVIQRAAIDILEPKRADQELLALKQVFSAKRNVMVEGLKELGIRFAQEPESTFYAWADLSNLPKPFNDSMHFFREALKHKVMTVPGEFFDVNPGKHRKNKSPYSSWMRFSFGPDVQTVKTGLGRLKEMLSQA